jgi:NAD(P)-dependent dehydrogenase (short-subunit alcohol dehydrogenase family)
MPRLKDRVVVITGGSTGIGRACALAYAREGASVVIGDVNEGDAGTIVDQIRNEGGESCFVRTDVGDPAQCIALVESAVSRFGQVDVVHANAGIDLNKPAVDTTPAEWQHVLDVNLTGAFHTCAEGMRQFLEADRPGVLTVTSSPHALVTSKDMVAYAASKGGMLGFMRALALEGAEYRIRANAILPGAIMTPMMEREVSNSSDPDGLLRTFAEATPWGRLGTPEDIAKVAVFLASDEAGFVTGTCLTADGGLMAVANAGPVASYTA